MAAVSWKLARAIGAVPTWGFQPPAMAAAQHSPEDVIGDLGGMPVKISRFVAEYVEYEGDPGWSGPRNGPPPIRTYSSRLESFGFEVRYPDMAMLTSSVMWADKSRYNIYNTPWMHVGIISGGIYPGHGFMNRPHVSNGQLKSEYWWENYEVRKSKKFGLTEYRLSGINPKTKEPASESQEAEVIYLYHDNTGNVLTRIDCSNVPHEAAPCEQRWDLGGQGVAAKVRVMYRRGHLENWRDIQKKVTEVVLSFQACSAESETATIIPASVIPK